MKTNLYDLIRSRVNFSVLYLCKDEINRHANSSQRLVSMHMRAGIAEGKVGRSLSFHVMLMIVGKEFH